MKTTFKGVRTRYVETPLIDSETLYMSMLGTLSDVDAATYQIGGGAGSSTGGYNGRNTARVIEQGPFVTYDVKTSDAIEYQESNPNAEGDSFAMEAVGKFIEALATKWHQAYKDTDYSDKFYINSFGAYGGGGNKSHSDTSLHYAGRAIDFRPMMKTKTVTEWNVGQNNYSSEQNKILLQMAIDMSNSNEYGVKIDNIILNDLALKSHFANVKNSSGGAMFIVTYNKGTGKLDYHNNHIHMEFDIPDSVTKDIASGNIPEAIASNGVKGTIVKVQSSARLNKQQKIAALGKI